MTILTIYLLFCLLIFIVCFGWMAIEDFILRKPDAKFGWNFKWPPWDSATLIFACALSCPVLNIVLVLTILWARTMRIGYKRGM